MSSLRLRAPTLDDVPALVELFEARQAAFGTGRRSEGQLRDELTSKHIDRALDIRLALEDGRTVGWGSIWHPKQGEGRVYLDVTTLPDDLAAARMLVDWGESRARELTAKPRLHVSALLQEAELADELRRRGYELVRHFLTMEIDLADEPPAPEWPEGVAVRTFRPEDARELYEADLEAFEDHWNSFPISFEEWSEYFMEGSEFDPELVFLAEAGGELAGFAICASERRPATGHIGVLGVRRAWRKRGIATALLLHSFGELRRRGRAKADLGVDAESLTGAVRLYERAGMRPVQRFDSFVRELE